MSYVAPGWPAVYTTLRGTVRGDQRVRTSKTDLHSGETAAPLERATKELGRLLTRLKGEDGKIKHPRLLYAGEAAVQGGLPPGKSCPSTRKDFLHKRVQAKALVGLKEVFRYSSASGRCPRSRFTASWRLHGVGAKTVIPAEATQGEHAVVQPEAGDRRAQLAAAVKTVSAEACDCERAGFSTAPIQRRSKSTTLRSAAGSGFKRSRGVRRDGRAEVDPRCAGVASAGAPVILTGIGLPDDRLHAPNEKLDLKHYGMGSRFSAVLRAPGRCRSSELVHSPPAKTSLHI